MDEQLSLGATASLRHRPLAERMRPRTLDEVVGQPQLTAPDAPLRVSLSSGAPHSMVLWGPPGTGKTTIALCVAAAVDADVEQLNAVTDGIKELRAVIARAQSRRDVGGRTPREAHMALIRKPEKPRRSPLLNLKLTHRKYQSWRTFLDSAYWSVELK